MKAEPGNKAYYYLYYNRENFLRLEADHALGTMDDDGHLTPRFMSVSDMDFVAFFNNVTYEIDSTNHSRFIPCSVSMNLVQNGKSSRHLRLIWLQDAPPTVIST